MIQPTGVLLPTDNICLRTDSYKVGHAGMYDLMRNLGAYMEGRPGAEHSVLIPFGWTYTIKRYLVGQVVTQEKIEQAAMYNAHHFGDESVFNREGWEIILKEHGGRLPLTIKAAPEGMPVPIGNVLATITLTKDDPRLVWIVNYVETLWLRNWYPITVATVSWTLKQDFLKYKRISSDDEFVPFMLHDFGARGVSSAESAMIGGAAHLVSFLGTDTMEGMTMAVDYYGADLATLAFSVRATDHSIMTQRGEKGEKGLLKDLLTKFRYGIFACVIDSYNADRFMKVYVKELKDLILDRKPNAAGLVKTVFRPDSLRFEGDTPGQQMVDYTEVLADIFGYTTNSKGFKVLNPVVGLLWGDGIGPVGINEICQAIIAAGWSVDHIVFGMGGGLLQKVNRDTERFATKACFGVDECGEVFNIQKNPLDSTKKSKKGKLKLVRMTDGSGELRIQTINHEHPLYYDNRDLLVDYFVDGDLMIDDKFEVIRQRAA